MKDRENPEDLSKMQDSPEVAMALKKAADLINQMADDAKGKEAIDFVKSTFEQGHKDVAVAFCLTMLQRGRKASTDKPPKNPKDLLVFVLNPAVTKLVSSYATSGELAFVDKLAKDEDLMKTLSEYACGEYLPKDAPAQPVPPPQP
jgi:hypothetical protein